MAIKPQCDRCNDELREYGAILLSPPSSDSTVEKFHICPDCYKEILKLIGKDHPHSLSPHTHYHA